MILGALPRAVEAAVNVEVQLQPDDRIVFYTDGITEVFNRNGEMLGVEGLQEIVDKSSCLPGEKMKQGILNEVAAWRDGAATDDESLVVVHIRRRDRALRLTETSNRSMLLDPQILGCRSC
jgi:serine phosphatase RsbU (regulator of sigma subunit)